MVFDLWTDSPDEEQLSRREFSGGGAMVLGGFLHNLNLKTESFLIRKGGVGNNFPQKFLSKKISCFDVFSELISIASIPYLDQLQHLCLLILVVVLLVFSSVVFFCFFIFVSPVLRTPSLYTGKISALF